MRPARRTESRTEAKKKVPSEGFEPPTFGTGNRRSIP